MAGNSRDFILNVIADATKADATMTGFADNAGKLAAGVGAAWAALNLSEALGEGMDAARSNSAAEGWLEASLGGVEEYARDAGQVAGELFGDGMTETLQESSAGVAAVTKNLGDIGELGQETFTNLTASALGLAQVMGEDVNKVTAAAASLYRSGLAPSAQSAFDLIAAGQASNVDKAEDLLDTVTEYSVAFRQAGLDGPTSLGLLSQALDAGARNSDIAADAIKEWGIRAQEAMANPVDPAAVASAQKAVQDAYDASARSAASTAEAVAAAEERVTDAQRDARSAQADLTQARRDAREALADLQDQLAQQELSERGAELAVERARQQLEKASLNGDELSKAEASLRYDQAVFNLDQARDRTKELAKEKETADRRGVEGSDQVRDAQRRVREADADVVEAQRDVQRAREEGAQSAADAMARIQEAQAALAAASTPQLTAIGQAYQRLGLDGEAIGDAVARGGKPAREALGLVLDRLREVDDPATRAQLAVELFGTKAEDMQRALYAMDVDTAAERFDNVAGAADRLGDSLGDNLAGRMQEMENKRQQFLAGLLDLPGPIGAVSQNLMVWGPTIGGVVSVIGPLVGGLAAMRAAQAAGAAATAAGAAANTGFAASSWAALAPMLLVIAAVAAVVGLGYLLVKNWDKVGPFFTGLWKDIRGAAGGAADWISGKWGDLMGWFERLPQRLLAIPRGFARLQLGILQTAVDGITWLWNNTIGKVGFSVPGWIPGVGGKSFDVPDIPEVKIPALADGGIALGPALALVGEGRGPEAIVPLDRWDEVAGNGGPREVHTHVYLDGRLIQRTVRQVDEEQGW